MPQRYPAMAVPEPIDATREKHAPAAHADARHWIHEPGVTFLNHGSFGGCPAAVLETQAAWRARLEGEPVRFFAEDLFDLLGWARQHTARFLGCDVDGLVFVPNATTGVATAIHNLIASGQAGPGDELLTTDHEYPACVNNARHLAGRAGIEVTTARLPFPHPTPGAVVEAVLSAVTPRTKIALLSQITSASALVLPAHALSGELERRGVRVVLDGAHAPGHVPMRVDDFGASYYAANLHKWVCSPKGSAVLYVGQDQRDRCRPMILSNLADSPLPGRNHLHTEFDYIGTTDPTAVLCVPAALRIMAAIASGQPPKRFPAEPFATAPADDTIDHAWSVVRTRNRALALAAQRLISERLGEPAPVPESMTGCIALAALPDAADDAQAGARAKLADRPSKYADALQDALIARWGIQTPIVHPATPRRSETPLRCVRVSAQLYNALAQYAYLAQALEAELARERDRAKSTPV